MEDKAFALLLAAATLAFAWILEPFLGPLLWSTVLALLFAPLFRRLAQSMGARRSAAAAVTVAIILVIVIIPVTVIMILLVNELVDFVQRVQSGQLDLHQYLQRLLHVLPSWVVKFLDDLGLSDLQRVQDNVSAWFAGSSQRLAAQAVSLGRHTLSFGIQLLIMVYLLFYLLRDGDMLGARIEHAIPLRPYQQQAIVRSFSVVVRSIVKSNVLVALLEGALGAVIFYVLGIGGALLWGALMALLSLVPSVGPALVWFPVAMYLLFTGDTWRGTILLAYGFVVISLVDTVLRSLLVGKDTRMPDYVVLLSVLGGLSVFGLNGLIIGPVIGSLFIAAWKLYE